MSVDIKTNECKPAVYDCSLEHPASFFVAGASSSGKSTWVKKLVVNRQFMFDRNIEKIIWCYAHWQDMFEDNELRDVDFVRGLTMKPYTEDTGVPKMVVVDDMMIDASRDKDFVQTFTTNRHVNVTTVFLTQNLFYGGFRTCSLNASYTVLMKAIRDRQQINLFLKQAFPGSLFAGAKAAIDDATKEPYSYAFLNMTQKCPDKLRIRARIFPDEWMDEGYYAQHVYVPV